MTVIAYTYNADYHCENCTVKYIKANSEPGFNIQGVLDGFIDFPDSEGNSIHALFNTDEWYANDIYEGNDKAILGCSDCHEVIEEVDLSGD